MVPVEQWLRVFCVGFAVCMNWMHNGASCVFIFISKREVCCRC